MKRTLSGYIDGIQVGDLRRGCVYEVGTVLGCYLLAEGWAVPVNEEPSIGMLRTPIQFEIPKALPPARVLSATRFRPAPRRHSLQSQQLAAAADRTQRVKKRRSS